MKSVTINGKEYTMPEMTFDAICELEERGVYLMGMDRSDRRFATMIRGIAAWIMDTDTATASRELQEHISNGGNVIDILTAATEAIEDSGFFGQQKQEQKPMNREQRRKDQRNNHGKNTNVTPMS